MMWIRKAAWLSATLVTLAFLLVLAACGYGESGREESSPSPSVSQTASPTSVPLEIHYEPTHPCGPGLGSYNGAMHENFLHWTREGSRLVFNQDDTIWAMDLEDGDLHQVADVDLNYDRRVLPGSRLRFDYGFHADVSPDGSHIVYSTCEYPDGRVIETYPGDVVIEGYELGTIDLKTYERKRLTIAAGLVNYPAWSPDGEQIAFVSSMDRAWDTSSIDRYYYPQVAERRQHAKVAVTASDGPTPMEGPFKRIESTARVALYPPVWSPDGQRLAYLAYEGEWPVDTALFAVRLDGSELARIGETTILPTWSPDGEELAFVSVDGESQIIYAVKPDGTDLRTIRRFEPGDLATPSPISQILWSPDGSELLLLSYGAYLVGQDGSDLRLLQEVGSRAAWSPDGSRIAVYGHAHTLYTVSRDGTDMRVLVEQDYDGVLVPVSHSDKESP